MALSKPPVINPIKPLPTNKPPPPSPTRDDFSHHTSPVHGPQAVAPEVVNASKPGAKIRTITEIPMHVTKHDGDS